MSLLSNPHPGDKRRVAKDLARIKPYDAAAA